MTLKAPKLSPASNVPVDQDNLFIVANGVAPVPHTTGSASAQRTTYHTTLSNTIASLEINSGTRFDLRNEDLKELQELGQGNGGSVKKVEHLPSNTIMAKKVRYIRFLGCPRNLWVLDCIY
jgi:mitogen-activated protein kinase kinase